MRTRYVEIYINCDNDSFAGELCSIELSRILRELSARVEAGAVLDGVTLADINGNSCGSFKFFERNTREIGTRKRGGV